MCKARQDRKRKGAREEKDRVGEEGEKRGKKTRPNLERWREREREREREINDKRE
jgi:hypothetical protein